MASFKRGMNKEEEWEEGIENGVGWRGREGEMGRRECEKGQIQSILHKKY